METPKLDKNNLAGLAENLPACSPVLLYSSLAVPPKSLSLEMVHIIIKPGKAATALFYPHYPLYFLQWREVARNAIRQLERVYSSLASR
jgi:hypothetical protein